MILAQWLPIKFHWNFVRCKQHFCFVQLQTRVSSVFSFRIYTASISKMMFGFCKQDLHNQLMNFYQNQQLQMQQSQVNVYLLHIIVFWTFRLFFLIAQTLFFSFFAITSVDVDRQVMSQELLNKCAGLTLIDDIQCRHITRDVQPYSQPYILLIKYLARITLPQRLTVLSCGSNHLVLLPESINSKEFSLVTID